VNLFIAILIFVIGLALVVFFSEKLVKGAIGTAFLFGISAFHISVIFIGFDPENLAVGAVGSFEEVAGIALGSVIGAAMVAIALAFGITALLSPMKFEKVSKKILITPVLAVLLMGALAIDGKLSRIDGAILLLVFFISIFYLIWMHKRGLEIKPTGELAESLDKPEKPNKLKSLGLLLLSLVAIIGGSELMLAGSKTILQQTGLSDTVFGMTILAFLVSIEELARELPAARKGRPDITYGNVVGSILAFFLFNAGIIALVKPVPVSLEVLWFYLPVCLLTVIIITLFMMFRKVSFWAGVVLVILYIVFAGAGYIYNL
jgi:cation:H+ antiporter